MDELKTLLAQVDDDYLVGLSNKGTVKRAYKDLEKETPALAWQESAGGQREAKVTLSEAECVIRVPLGESGCSCPSRSICRHIVTAILWLRKEMADGESVEAAATKARTQAEVGLSEDEAESAAAGGATEPADGLAAERNNGESTGETPKKVLEKAARETARPKALTEALAVSPEKLKRLCGNRRIQRLVSLAKAGELPAVEETSIATVLLPWDRATVKLLEPLAYSTCSCHSRELCVHKAQAILIYQFHRGALKLNDLEALLETGEAQFIPEDVVQACQAVVEAADRQLCTGLSRQSPEVEDQMERLAVMAHRGGLADLESRLRQVQTEYRRYFARSAAFRDDRLLTQLLEIRRLADRLKQITASGGTTVQQSLRQLAGTFRDDYIPVGTLELIGVGSRHFESDSGYEGETYYFLETKKRQWYTWTDARPTFYEGGRRRPTGGEGAPAPWGLNCKREDLTGMKFQLKEAKAASGNRLSASQESQAAILDTHGLRDEIFLEMIRDDYERLAEDYEQWYRKHNSGSYLTLVCAGSWETPSFDRVQQRFFWELKDRNGRRLSVSLRYSPTERAVISMLERLEKKLSDGGHSSVAFFGSLYLKDGELHLYPIEYYLGAAAEAAQAEAPRIAKTGVTPPPEILDGMELLIRDGRRRLADLLVSGLWSVPQDCAEGLMRLAQEMGESGLAGACRMLEQIGEALLGKRHSMEFDPRPVIEEMQRLDRYLTGCETKLNFDRAKAAMK